MAHICNLSTWEAEAQDGELEATQVYNEISPGEKKK